MTPGLAGGVSAPTATLQNTLGHWPLLRGARQKDSPEKERGKTLHKRGWNGTISFFLCSPQHAAKPGCRTTGGQKAFSAVTRRTGTAATSSCLSGICTHVLLCLQAKEKQPQSLPDVQIQNAPCSAAGTHYMVALINFCRSRSQSFSLPRPSVVEIRGSLCPGDLNSVLKMTFCPQPLPSFLDAGT